MKTALSLTFTWILLCIAGLHTELYAQNQLTCTPATGAFSTGTVRMDYSNFQFIKQDDQIKVGEAIGQYLYYGWAVIDISQIPDAATITSLSFSNYSVLISGVGNDCRIVRLDADPVSASGDAIVNGMSSVEFITGANYMMQNGGLMTVALNSYAVIDFQTKLSSGANTWALAFYEYGGNDPYGTMQGYSASRPQIVVNYSCNLPQATSLSGPAIVCEGDSVSFTANGVPAASTFNWSLPPGWTITSGQGTATIHALAGALTATVCVAATNGCGAGLDFCDTIEIVPAASAGTINGPTSLCEGEEVVYNMISLNAIGTNWTVPSGWTILSGQGTLTLVAAAGSNGGLMVATPYNGCGVGSASQAMITVNPLPLVTMSALPPVCFGDPPFILTAGSPAGGTYSGPGVNSLTSMFDPDIAGGGTHTINYEYALGPCDDEASTSIFVDLCSGIESPIENTELQITPNPNKGVFMVGLPDEMSGTATVQIVDGNGKLIKTYYADKADSPLHIQYTGLEQGVYYLRVSTGSAVIQRPFIVQY